MPSYGEGTLICDSTWVGTVRVLYLRSDSGLCPRLRLTIGLELRHAAEGARGPAPFELTNLSGELRMEADAAAFGLLQRYGRRDSLRSSIGGHGDQVDLVCELDPWRIEQVERHRQGREPVLWLDLWPEVRSQGQQLHAVIEKVRVAVPRDVWLGFLKDVRKCTIEVLELQWPPMREGVFRAALGHTRRGRELIDAGQYDEAVACCRKAVEAIGHELDGEGKDKSTPFLETATGPEKAKEYAGIISKIKQLAGMAIHDFGRQVEFSRVEAVFLVSVAERIIALIGDLAQGGGEIPSTSPPG